MFVPLTLLAGVLYAAAFYLLLARSKTKLVFGLLLLGLFPFGFLPLGRLFLTFVCGVELENHLARRDGIAFGHTDRSHFARRGRRHFRAGLVCLELEDGLICFDAISFRYEDAQHLGFINVLS